MRFLLFLLILPTSFAFAAPIEVSVDRNPAYLNESFEIVFTATEEPNVNPDFSPLKKDFEILNKNHSNSMSWINGERTQQVKWTFTVMAKNAGKLKIPPVNFGDVSSSELSITISKDRDAVNEPEEMNAPLFLEVEATPLNPYLQSQLIYTLRFFRRVNIAEASLKELELNDAVVEKLGEDKNYKTHRGGMSYAVTERKYAVFPQKSGKMIIEPLELTASVIVSSRSRGFFGNQSTRRERVQSKAITLDVRPVPDNFKGEHWLAAYKVKLVQQWSGDNSNMQVGEPLTRTLTLMVDGATVGQLPDLQQAYTKKGLKNYPDQPTLKEKKTENGVIAFREEKIAFIPSKAGSYTLPEISVDWFNVKTGKMENTQIAETIVTAIGGVVNEINTNETKEKEEVAVSATPNTANVKTPSSENNWLWKSMSAFFAVAWLVTLFMYFNKKNKSLIVDNHQPETDLKECISNLKKACHNNEAQLAKQALLTWGQLRYQSSSLGTLANFCEGNLRDEILILNKSLYGQQATEWRGLTLLQAFIKYKTTEKTNTKTVDDKLEPLYRI
ncbi:MAG: protein BatD [Methylococcaceae bacterium]|nr:protein BatD [Methylococcaceae bacterium]